jgi:prephenate dehydrogenase
VAKRSAKAGCVGRTEWNLINACEDADLIVISTPIGEIQSTFQAIGQYLKPDCVVTDTAPVKTPVLEWASTALPDTVRFVGGHPIAPRRPRDVEAPASADAPSAELFEGGVYCLAPGTDTPPGALRTVTDLAQTVGAEPYFLDASEHDGLIAAIEGLPLLLAAALQSTVSKSPSIRELLRLSGTHFEAATQLLANASDTLADLLVHNAENNTRWVRELATELTALGELAAAGDVETLRTHLSNILDAKANWISKKMDAQTIDYSDFGMSSMMFGDTFKPRRPRDG